jgi:hypothetical protein
MKQKNVWQKNEFPRRLAHIFLPDIFLPETCLLFSTSFLGGGFSRRFLLRAAFGAGR